MIYQWLLDLGGVSVLGFSYHLHLKLRVLLEYDIEHELLS